ncbi:MAG: Mov34/MPN/PAD-1 family protein [Methanocellales archaeon]|nr:Mov34/MPN/PAD-1 family protein [Methanocellales archaeon]MDD3292242.1 Mov34/MPN/PAD-1 family protein [Methanocellales archaeon]MDD5234772.1 Mov34/MPN/PAD-1 family protein [Methanocellales archaeon]MDD5484858.1 Mov34/MPN/PAD-1 family protein [Methanocellales archaeon]
MLHQKIRGIARDTLHFLLEVSKSSHPNEFAGLLRAEEGVITDVIVLPGTVASSSNAVMQLHMMPLSHCVGSVHSHPSADMHPSNEDLMMFGRKGDYHIIAAYPYDENSWACYDAAGRVRNLPVLDVEFEEE